MTRRQLAIALAILALLYAGASSVDYDVQRAEAIAHRGAP
jgi:hypothetical protein